MSKPVETLKQQNFEYSRKALKKFPNEKPLQQQKEYIKNRYHDKQGYQDLRFGPGQLGKNLSVHPVDEKTLKNDV